MKYYVTAVKYDFPYSTKRLLGPFDKFSAASRMIMPVRRALVDDPEYAAVNFRVTDLPNAKCRPGALDLSKLNPADVIEASR